MRALMADFFSRQNNIRSLFAVAALGLCCGCYEAPPPPPMIQFDLKTDLDESQSREKEAERTAERESATAAANQLAAENTIIPFGADQDAVAWITPDRLPWSIDYVQYLNGRQIGFSHIEVLPPMNVDGRLTILRTDVIETNLSGQPSRAEIKLDAFESNTGKLIDLNIETKHRGITTSSKGRFLESQKLTIDSVGPDSATTRKTIQWKEGTWGTLGVQSLLLRQPLITAGERRSATVFIPSLMEIAEVEIVAGEPELTPLVGGVTPELLPIDVVMRTETSGMRSRNWINGAGEIEKTLALTGPSVTTFRVPRDITRRLASAIQMEGWMSHTIELNKSETIDMGAVNGLRDRLYFIKSLGDLNILHCPRQDVVSLVPGEADVTIRSTPRTPTELTQSGPTVRYLADEPTDADRLPNTWLPSEHPTIATLAEELLDAASNPGEIASQLTRAVAESIENHPLDTRFTSVLETARNETGDCIDRAMLLTTLLRNRQIPARVRSGLRLETAPSAMFHYHMWTEAWIDEQWQSYDPTSGEPITVGYIAMVHEPLGEENPYEAIVPVLEALQGIVSIEVRAKAQ